MTGWAQVASRRLDTFLDVSASLAAVHRQEAAGATKVEEDLERYAAVIGRTEPDVIVECGTWRGGSALWFAAQGARVITVDVDHSLVCDEAQNHPLITLVSGDSASDDVAAQVAALLTGTERVMVVLDSDHRPDHVQREIGLYAGLVSLGCYLVVEDGILRWMAGPGVTYPGPLDAIELCLDGNPGWVRDVEIESLYSVTMHPAGWWRKRAR